jgi:hypothetical protein
MVAVLIQGAGDREPSYRPRMTPIGRRATRSRCRGRVAATAALTPVLVGCGAGAAPVSLPARPPAVTRPVAGRAVAGRAVAGGAAAASARQRVIAALVGYTAALSAAEKSRNAAAARWLLQPYLAASRIAAVVQTMSSIWADGEVFFGQDILHVLSVTITGQSAFVHDCDDTSAKGLDYEATGQVVPGSAGISELNIVTHLALTGGRWLVLFQLVEDVPCTP